MSTLPGIHDTKLITRPTIDQQAWTAAWRAATINDTDDPKYRGPATQVGTCHMHGCRQPIVPTNPPEVHGHTRYFEAICSGCGRSYAATAPLGAARTANHPVDWGDR